MSNKMNKLIVLVTILFFGIFFNISAQSETDETDRAKQRAETLLQIIREEKWNELDKFVVEIKLQIDKKTGNSVKTFHKITDNQTKEKVIARFKRTYSRLKPGKIYEITLDSKDKTRAFISYKHEDRDGFTMVLLDGEWYYAMEYL